MIKQQKHPVETFIGRMTGHWLVGNLLLAISYFLTASIGLSLATVPGYATVVWPASGIALGWILLFGWRLLAGVVLGSFIVNVMNAANHAHIGLLEVGRTVPLLIAMGAALQAWVGSQLIRRYVPNLSAFEAPRTVIRTLVLGGFIATLISATWGVSTLYFFGIVNGDLWLKNWLTWWLGDSIGIWVFTPLMLVWGLPDAFYDRTRAFIVMIVSCGAFVLASLSFLLATALEKSERAGNFEVSGQRVVSQMQQRFGEYDEFSVMVRRFFDSSELVTRNEFQRFVSEWLQQHPEVQAVEWAARLSHQHRQAWQQQMSLEFGHSILVAEKNPQSDALVSPAAERTEYLPLTYVVPLAQNKAVLGLDVFTHAGSKELLLRAVTHGKPVLSSPFKLIQANQQAPASFLYTPVYNLPISSQPTWSDIKGFIVVVLKNDQVLAALANKIVPRGQTLMVTDQSTGLVLYGEQADSSVMAVSHQMGLEYFSTIRVGQQIWQIALWPEAQQIEAYSSWLTWMVLVIGLIGTSIAVSYTLISTGHYQYLEREITTQTQIFRQQNEDLKLSRLEAERANAAKGQFLANMSHEIRTPMNGVLGMTDLLQTTELSVQQQQFVRVLQLSGKALLHIINDILDYSKVEAGKIDIEQIDMDLEALILECASIFAMTAETKKLDFVAFIEPKTPVFIQSDPMRLRQILLNLLSNAFKFTHQGCVSLHVHVHTLYGQQYLQFVVSDTGIGMTQEQKAKLFQAFTQADSSTTRQFGGTGLGLSISKHLVDLMSGEIKVESQIGKGSIFTVTIPYTAASQRYIHDHWQTQTLLHGLRVLFVDHSYEFTHMMTAQARAWGMIADAVHDGKHALALMEQAYEHHRPYDVVVLEFALLPMSGLAVAEKMAQIPELATIKRLLLTSLRASVTKQQLANAGVGLVVPKPTSSSALWDSLLVLLGKQANEQSLPLQTQDDADLIQLLHPKRLMVVEDNVVNQMVILGMLKKLGIDAEVANNGLEAVNLYSRHPAAYDLILMDCEMPVLDGYLATEKIRDLERHRSLPAVPIVALTAHAMREQQQRCITVGMDNFLSKPLVFDSLKQMLKCIFVSIEPPKAAEM